MHVASITESSDLFTFLCLVPPSPSLCLLLAIINGIVPCSVDVSVRRVGGAFGGKAKRPKFAAIACALGAHATKRYRVLQGRDE